MNSHLDLAAAATVPGPVPLRGDNRTVGGGWCGWVGILTHVPASLPGGWQRCPAARRRD